MDLNRTLIDRDEGDKTQPNKDSLGIWTVGIGHNLETNGLPPGVCTDAPGGLPYPDCLGFLQRHGGLKEQEIEDLFDYDLKVNCDWLWLKPWWGSVSPERQAALNDMAFNLGPARAQAFTTFYGLCAIGDWPAAAGDLEFKTAVGKQLPHRYGRLEQILRTGQWPKERT